MRIYQPKNEYGQDLLSTADVVESIKTVTKAISGGAVEITKNDLGTDKASDWTVLEVVYGGNKIMADVTSADDKITVTLDNAGSAFSGNVTVTLTYESAMNISQEAQQPPVVKRGEIRGLKDCFTLFSMGPISLWDCDLPDLQNSSVMFQDCTSLTSFASDMPALTNGDGMFRSCDSLTSFSGKLSSLTNGTDMFSGCNSLTSFTSDLPALTNAGSMFYGCKLDQASVDHILATINDLKAQGASATITLGVASGVDKRTSEFAAKGWTVN